MRESDKAEGGVQGRNGGGDVWGGGRDRLEKAARDEEGGWNEWNSQEVSRIRVRVKGYNRLMINYQAKEVKVKEESV